jgi:thiosulfate/3-mercaptopyruvate sulfurtransferase
VNSSSQPLVETDWLAAHLDDPALRIVDARWRGDGSGRQLYLESHIPGAIHLDWHADLNGGSSDDMLLPPEQFATLMEANGIGNSTRVVAYAETDHSGAARLWWALRYHGHYQVAVLNGGFTRWLAEGRPVTAELRSPPFARFVVQLQPTWLATAADIEATLANPGASLRLVDTRPVEQYAGRAVWTPDGSLFLPVNQDRVEVAGRQLRGGRIPGAVHLHASRNLAADWTYRSPAELRALAEAAGVKPDQRVILYCGVGISASLGLFALHLAGYQNLALYDASWLEWGSDPQRPLERDRES